MSSLIPCTTCNCHVKSDETRCPFCQAALVPRPSSKICQGPCSGHSAPRLGRVALMAAGAALLCAACQASTIAAYGTPPRFDAGNPTVDAGGQNDGATDAGDAKKL
jgi:hypothetical protein